MQRSIFRNLALSLLAGLGVGSMFPSVSDVAPAVQRRNTRWGRNSQVRAERKDEFAAALNQGDARPKHIGVARKAALGEIGLNGPRGLQVRRMSGTGRNSVYRITR